MTAARRGRRTSPAQSPAQSPARSPDRSPSDVDGRYFPLRQYAVLADGERGALVSPTGSVAFLCAPRWHDEAVFSSLVGGAGSYQVSPTRPSVWGGSYEDGTLIWRSRWTTTTSQLECREALALPTSTESLTLLRQIQPGRGEPVSVRLHPRAGFGRLGFREVRQVGDRVWTGRTGDLRVRWTAPADARVEDGGDGPVLCWDGVTGAEPVDLVLEVSRQPFGDLPDPATLWAGTEVAWAERVPRLSVDIGRSHARRAVAVLSGLTSSSGAMVAAVTTSLPERARQGADYDYRYAWIRDQCYAGTAAFNAGVQTLGDAATGFVSERLLADGPDLAPAYKVDGDPVDPQRELRLAGYPGGKVRVGNQARIQTQLDMFGEALVLFATAATEGEMTSRIQQAADVAIAAIQSRWETKDAGVWELDAQWWTHSRLVAVAGLRAWAKVTPSEATAVSTLADVVMASTATRCLHPSGRWQRSADDDRVDASLLLGSLRGALPPDDPRSAATLAAVRDELSLDGFVYRYRPDARELGEAEGSFLLCTYWLAMAEAQAGETTTAVRRLERALAAAGPPGLYSEEFDVHQRQLRGNLPQAFVHALALESCVSVPRALEERARTGW